MVSPGSTSAEMVTPPFEFQPLPITSVDEGPILRLRHGDPQGEPDFELLGGYFQFESANAALLVGLLPAVVHLRGGLPVTRRLASLVELITGEVALVRPGRSLVLRHLVEVMLIEALRIPSDTSAGSMPGLLKGLADPELAETLRAVHADIAGAWSVAEMAGRAGLSRSTFSERFKQTIGLSPMEYLAEWRMAVAKDLLTREKPPLEELATRVGYQSASAFSTAFRRRTGQPPSHFARR